MSRWNLTAERLANGELTPELAEARRRLEAAKSAVEDYKTQHGKRFKSALRRDLDQVEAEERKNARGRRKVA